MTFKWDDTVKRFTYGGLRFQSKIPGLKRISQRRIARYEEDFWRTYAVELLVSMYTASLIRAVGKHRQQKREKALATAASEAVKLAESANQAVKRATKTIESLRSENEDLKERIGRIGHTW